MRGIVDEIRAHSGNRDLLDAVWYRLADEQLLARDDLQESLAQMRRGETAVKPSSHPSQLTTKRGSRFNDEVDHLVRQLRSS